MNWDEIKQGITSTAMGTFGRTLTFKPKTGSPYDVTAIFTRDYVEVQMGNSLPVSMNKAVLDVELAQFLTRPTQADKFGIDGTDYKITDIQDNGGGGARCILEKA